MPSIRKSTRKTDSAMNGGKDFISSPHFFFMMKLIFAFIAAALVFQLQAADALEISEYNISFEVLPDMKVSETVSITFPQPLNETAMNYIVAGSVSDVSITNGKAAMDYTLEKKENGIVVKFQAPAGTESLFISFVSNDLVFSGDGVYSFFTSLTPPEAGAVTLKAYLPKGFAIYRNVVYPDGYSIMSDGEMIYLQWDATGAGEIPVSFKFYSTRTDYSMMVFAATSITAAGLLAYLVFYYRRKVRREFVRGFSEDERKILSALAERKTCMQNKLERECEFSRAKMTRVVKKLEGKGLVEKERVGRTNRLFYRKK
jgi:uncharacterized membrane protein